MLVNEIMLVHINHAGIRVRFSSPISSAGGVDSGYIVAAIELLEEERRLPVLLTGDEAAIALRVLQEDGWTILCRTRVELVTKVRQAPADPLAALEALR